MLKHSEAKGSQPIDYSRKAGGREEKFENDESGVQEMVQRLRTEKAGEEARMPGWLPGPCSPPCHTPVGALFQPGGDPCRTPASCLPPWPWDRSLLAPFPGGHQEDGEQEEGTFVQAPSYNQSSGQGQAEGPAHSLLPSSFPAP